MDEHYLSISAFSKLTGIRRENLIFYDKIGLLPPDHRNANSYRSYTRHQLSTAYMITSLRELKIPLKDIKQYADSRTPETMFALFESQEKQIRDEMNKLCRLQEIMALYREMVQDAFNNEQSGICVSVLPAEPIFLGPVVPDGVSEDDSMQAFYTLAFQKGMELGFPLGTVVSQNHFLKANGSVVKQYYFKVKQGGNTVKPAGTYVSAYGRCRLGQAQAVYKNLIDYLETHHLQPVGDLYEEYPISELATHEEISYCVKISIMVSALD